ncbi:5' nucleotidase, NT5C type [Paraburkholderia jirisanensis]
MYRYPVRVAIDMDEVIADSFTAQRDWLQRTYSHSWNDEDGVGRNIRQLVEPHHYEKLQELLHEGSFFRGLSVMPGAQDALKHLSKKFEIFIATAAMEYPASCAAKFAWLEEHFSFVSPQNIVFCGDKSILDADFLIDDNVRHFSRFRGQGVLFSAPHNRMIPWTPRVDSWAEVIALLEQRA